MHRVPSQRGSAAAPLLPKRHNTHPLPGRTLLSSRAPRCSPRSPGSAAPCAPAPLPQLRGCSPHRGRAQPEAAAGTAVLPGRELTGNKSCPGAPVDIAAAAGRASQRQQQWCRALSCQQRGKAVRPPLLENTSNPGLRRLRNIKDAGLGWLRNIKDAGHGQRRCLGRQEEHSVLDSGFAVALTALRSHPELLSARGSPCPGRGVSGSSASSPQQRLCWWQRFGQHSRCLGWHPTRLEDKANLRHTAAQQGMRHVRGESPRREREHLGSAPSRR